MDLPGSVSYTHLAVTAGRAVKEVIGSGIGLIQKGNEVVFHSSFLIHIKTKLPIHCFESVSYTHLGQDLGVLTNVEISETGPGGVALKVTFTGEKGSASVETENKIRRAFGGSGYEITKQDGTVTESQPLLPSRCV